MILLVSLEIISAERVTISLTVVILKVLGRTVNFFVLAVSVHKIKHRKKPLEITSKDLL